MTGATSESATKPRRLFIVEDHPVFRRGLVQLLEDEPDLSVVGWADRVEEAVTEVAASGCDLVVADLGLNPRGGSLDESGLQLVRQIRDVPVLVVSMHDEAVVGESAILAGASGYVMKHRPAEAVVEAVRRVLDGRLAISPELSERLVRRAARGEAGDAQLPSARLSQRELEVFEAVGRGLATRDIAGTLHISAKTVGTHLARVRVKLGLESHLQLIQAATRWVDRNG